MLVELTADPDEDIRLAARKSLVAALGTALAVDPPREKTSLLKWLTG